MESISRVNSRKIKSYNNYINKIRFPKFKNFTKDMEVTFDYPLTILTGPNGCGKTSVLQALYGSPKGYSISKFWFSTDLDPIKEGSGESSRFIYEYTPKGLPKKVEVIKKRVGNKKGNDYWESARPSVEDNMDVLEKTIQSMEGDFRSETRWNLVDKKVTYINFKEIISPYDKFMNYGEYSKGKIITSKQDFIRSRTKHLRKALQNDKKVTHYNRKVSSIKELGVEELKWVSKILGKEYVSAKILDHDLFNNKGRTVIFNEANSQYSEAVAGSGEVSVVSTVMEILESPDDGLILLDEPEVSLHPAAQRMFRELLLEKCSKSGCQVVLTTHSPFFIDGMPDSAIKTFYQDPVTRKQAVINYSSKDEAFVRIGSLKESDCKNVFVEDDLAKLLFDKAIQELNPVMSQLWVCKVFPGGAETIKKNLLIDMVVHESDIKILLDGDKELNVGVISSDEIPVSKYHEIDKILLENTGIKKYPLPLNGGNASNLQQSLEMKLKIIDKYRKNISFIPCMTPEEFILNISGIDIEDYPEMDNKQIFESITKDMFDEEVVSSVDIYTAQRHWLTKRDVNHKYWVKFKSVVSDIIKSDT